MALHLRSVKKNIGCVLGIGGGQKASNEFYSRLNYTVVDKVLRKMGMPEADVQEAVKKYKAHFPEWRLDSFPGFLGNVTAGASRPTPTRRRSQQQAAPSLSLL